jgi:hypothetical protein
MSTCTLANQTCGAQNAHCPKNINTHYQFIRPCYCPTTYFNARRPDPHTYLQYWRRRMCYMNYLQYNGILPQGAKKWPENSANPTLRSCPRPFNTNGRDRVPYASGGNLCA